MSSPGNRIEDYALLGDLHSAALVGRDGSIDWRSEEWDPAQRRQLGNTPQAFSHFPMVASALRLNETPVRSEAAVR